MWEASRIVLDRYSIIPRAQARGIDFSFPDWKEMALLELFLAFPGGDFRIKNTGTACWSGILHWYTAFLEDYWDYFTAKLSIFISVGRGWERVTRASRCDSAPQAARHHGMMRGDEEYKMYTFPDGENYKACHAGA